MKFKEFLKEKQSILDNIASLKRTKEVAKELNSVKTKVYGGASGSDLESTTGNTFPFENFILAKGKNNNFHIIILKDNSGIISYTSKKEDYSKKITGKIVDVKFKNIDDLKNKIQKLDK